MDVIEHPPIFRLPGIPDHVTYTWVVMIVLTVVAFAASRNLQLVPRGAQNFMEVVIEQIQQLIDDVMGPEGRRYLPLIATLGLFILAANLESLIPGFAGPTANLNTTAACALVVFFAYHYIGIRKHGAGGYVFRLAGDGMKRGRRDIGEKLERGVQRLRRPHRHERQDNPAPLGR